MKEKTVRRNKNKGNGGLNRHEVFREMVHSWGKQGTGELGQTKNRGSKTKHNKHNTRGFQNKTGSN